MVSCDKSSMKTATKYRDDSSDMTHYQQQPFFLFCQEKKSTNNYSIKITYI